METIGLKIRKLRRKDGICKEVDVDPGNRKMIDSHIDLQNAALCSLCCSKKNPIPGYQIPQSCRSHA